MTTFTLRREHLDLLAASNIESAAEGFFRVESVPLSAQFLTETEISKRNDVYSIKYECCKALQIILSARGEAVPLGRYELRDGRWTLVEERA